MDRTDAPPAKGFGAAVSTRPGVRWRGGSVPRRAALAGGPDRAVEEPRPRGAARLWAACGAGPGHSARGCARGVVPAQGACGDRPEARGGAGTGGTRLQDAPDPRAAHPLGELLDHRRDELQLEAADGSGRDPRLRGRARGRPPGRTGPLAALLEPRGLTLPAVARTRALAAFAWARLAPRTAALKECCPRASWIGVGRQPPGRTVTLFL